MATKHEKIIQEIGNLTVIELSDFIAEFEKAFNVSAAMPVMAAASSAPAAAAEEKLEFTVTLKELGPNKLNVMKALRQVKAGLGLIEAKQMAENTPSVVGEKVPKDDAKKWKETLEKEGAKVELS
jgi:large subunit ribosomal protein L7/L12